MKATDCDRLLGAAGDVALSMEEMKAKWPMLPALPIADLARAGLSTLSTGTREETNASREISSYVGGLSHQNPQLAMDFIEELMARQPDELVVSMLGGGLLYGLVRDRGSEVIDRLEALTRDSRGCAGLWLRLPGCLNAA